MQKIGLVTCERFRVAASEDDILVEEFLRRGYACDRPAWEDKTVNWNEYSALIIRSTWDYPYHMQEFMNWITQIEASKISLYNPPAVLRWNSNKLYLRELESKGVPFPKTEWVLEGEPINLAAIMDNHDWSKAVVKPIVGGGGYFTFLISREESDTHQALAQKELTQHGVMVQEFLPEITEVGEWSFLFFGNEFSHAVMKTPKSGEFRIQAQFGGIFAKIAPPQDLIAQAQAVLKFAPGKLLYARVDGIVRNGQFILIELEILEPSVFLTAREDSAERVVNAFERMRAER